jgi:hypothetical protein
MCFRDVPSRLSSREARRIHGRSPVVEDPRGMQPPVKMWLARALEPPIGRRDAMRTAAGIDGQIVDSPTASTTQDLDAWLVGTSTGREEAPGCISRMAIAGASQKDVVNCTAVGVRPTIGLAQNKSISTDVPTGRLGMLLQGGSRLYLLIATKRQRFGSAWWRWIRSPEGGGRYGTGWLAAWPSGCRDVAEETYRSSTRSGLGGPGVDTLLDGALASTEDTGRFLRQ